MAAATDYTILANVEKLSEVDPELKAFLASGQAPAAPPLTDPTDLGPARAERRAFDAQHAAVFHRPNVTETTRDAPMRDGFSSEMRILSPRDKSTPSPLMVLYYGGGFMFGNNYQLAAVGYACAELFNATVVLPSYRLAPEHPFPYSPHDAWDSFIWATTHASSLGADASAGLVLGGASAGANLAAVVAQKALTDAPTPRITGLWLNIPVVLSPATVPDSDRHLFISREQNAHSIGLDKAAVDRVHAAYKPDESSALWSPYNAPSPHTGMPATYFQVCGWDPLRDDGLIYERTLRNHGVKTDMDVYPGVPHGHTLFFPELASAKKSAVDAIVGLGRLLGKEVSGQEVQRFFLSVAKKTGVESAASTGAA